MRIVIITPGSGDHFYCENCRRDLDTVMALRQAGHDATLVPLYLPIAEAEAAGDLPVFYGAVNVYLEQVLPSCRLLPRAWRRWLDAVPVLDWAAARARSTRAGSLEALTLSVLRGENGRQAAELQRLTDWLRQSGKPDVVHLSNALLLGLAGRIHDAVGAPVVCSLQDEDTWIDSMPAPWPARIWSIMTERARDVALFLPVSRTYGELMAQRLRLPATQWRVVYPGIDTTVGEPATPPPEPTIGYYARLSAELGLGDLARAFFALRRRPELRPLRLLAAGGMTSDDRPFVRRLRKCVHAEGADHCVTIRETFAPGAAAAFTDNVTVLCVPVPGGEAFGLFSLEALRRGIPVVLPAAGAFPELAGMTDGILLYPPGEPEALENALASVLLDQSLRQRLAGAGKAGVRRHFDLTSCTVPNLVAAYTAAGAARPA